MSKIENAFEGSADVIRILYFLVNKWLIVVVIVQLGKKSNLLRFTV